MLVLHPLKAVKLCNINQCSFAPILPKMDQATTRTDLFSRAFRGVRSCTALHIPYASRVLTFRAIPYASATQFMNAACRRCKKNVTLTPIALARKRGAMRTTIRCAFDCGPATCVCRVFPFCLRERQLTKHIADVPRLVNSNSISNDRRAQSAPH